MGTSRSTAELVGKINHYATVIPKANRLAVQNAALGGKQIMLSAAVGAGLNPASPLPRENRRGKAGTARWGVRYDVKGTSTPTALLRYTGPVHWVDGGTKAHLIVPSKSRARLRSGGGKKARAALVAGFLAGQGGGGMAAKGVMAIGGPPGGRGQMVRSGVVNHPGSAARPFWQAAKKQVITGAKKTAESTHSRALIEAFR